MKRYRASIVITTICCCLFIFCVSCGRKETPESDNPFYLYTVNQDGDEIESKEMDITISDEKVSDTVSEIIKVFREEERIHKAYHAKESTCEIINFQLENEQLTLNFDAGYSLMSTVDEVLHRAALVKTFTQLNVIKEVQFTTDGQPLTIDNKAVGFMKGEDFINNTANSDAMKTTIMTLYFANTSGTALIEVPVDVTYDSSISIARLMITELIKGPEGVKGINQTGLRRTLPEDVTCNSITIRDNICYIDFSVEFTNVIPGLNGDIIIYSVVNLLSALPNVDKVQFTIEGEYIELPGFPEMYTPFERNLNIVEK